MTDYTSINYVFLALGLINGTLFVVSELIGFINRHSIKSTSLVEAVGRYLKFFREPTFEELLAHLEERRANALV